MPRAEDDRELQYAIRELAKAVETGNNSLEKRLNEHLQRTLEALNKNEELIRRTQESLKALPTELEKIVLAVISKELTPERALETARKVIDGLRQGMHLFLGGNLSGPPNLQGGGIVPASAFPPRPPNPFTMAAMEKEQDDGQEPPHRRSAPTASFQLTKEGKVDISIDRQSRLAIAAAVLAVITGIGWVVQAIIQAVHK